MNYVKLHISPISVSQCVVSKKNTRVILVHFTQHTVISATVRLAQKAWTEVLKNILLLWKTPPKNIVIVYRYILVYSNTRMWERARIYTSGDQRNLIFDTENITKLSFSPVRFCIRH